MKEVIVAFLAISGTFFIAVGSYGIWKMPDLYCRMHTQTKAGTLGLIGILLAAALHLGTTSVTVQAILTILFQLLTSATGAHIMSRAAHHSGVALWNRSLFDALRK